MLLRTSSSRAESLTELVYSIYFLKLYIAKYKVRNTQALRLASGTFAVENTLHLYILTQWDRCLRTQSGLGLRYSVVFHWAGAPRRLTGVQQAKRPENLAARVFRSGLPSPRPAPPTLPLQSREAQLPDPGAQLVRS